MKRGDVWIVCELETGGKEAEDGTMKRGKLDEFFWLH
jgi:hypothetical protein